MQRKRTRGFYSDNVELGTNILPVAQMKKFTMKKIVKFVTLAVIVYFVYIVYQKISQASKSTLDAEYWPEGKVSDRNQEQDRDGGRKRDEEENNIQLEKRVKEHVNQVFEELKHKQRENKDREEKRDVFEDYKRDNKLKDDNNEAWLKQMVDDLEKGKDQAGDDTLRNDDDEQDQEANYNVGGNNDDDMGLFEVDEDPEKEKQELEIEKEIEERLAEAFKEAGNKAADDIGVKQKNEILEAEMKKDILGGLERKDEEMKIPEVKQVFEKQQFKYAVNNMGKNLNPLQVQQMNIKAQREALKHDTDHEFPPFVTAVRKSTIDQVTQLVASIQQFMPGRKIYIYDLDLDKNQKRQFVSFCGVKMHYFMKELFPKYVSDLDKMHWKPLVLQTALAEFGHLIWVNPQFRLGSQELAPLVHDSHEQGILVVGQSASYSTFSATHPDMMKFIPTDTDKLTYHPHVEIRAIFVHNTPEVHENIMKVFTACALEESCLAPKGAKWNCKFDFTGRKPADCHRFDESAMNILLKNWFQYDASKYVMRSNAFRTYDQTYRPKLKTCRDVKDIRDSEL